MDASKYNEISDALQQLLDEGKEQLPAETTELLAFLFSTSEGRTLFNEWFERQKSFGEMPDISYDRIYQRIQQHVDASIQKPKPKTRRLAVTFLQRAAAILFVPVLGCMGYFMYQNHVARDEVRSAIVAISPSKQHMEYYSPAGARLRVVLPDSTEVWLNGDSRLCLSQTFGVGDRDVKLQGQAFFHVKRNERSPFIVRTGSIDIKALGTSFNVLAYPNENRVEAVLISGKVEINREAGGREAVVLKPNQKLSFNKASDSFDVADVYSEPYHQWTQGRLIFNDDPMDKVANVLEHYYNVKIIINDPKILTYRFTATIENSSIEQIMEYIGYSSSVQYTIKKNQITISQKK